MKYLKITISLLIFTFISLHAHDVGFRKVDNVSKDGFSMVVLYPTSSKPKPVTFGPFTLNVAIGGKVEEGRFPLAVLSHGSGSSNLSYKDIAISLVTNGFIVVMPLHPKNNYLDNSFEGKVENYINRPKQISSSIDKVLSMNSLSTHIDNNKIAVLGHSIGGYTALVVSGAIAKTKDLIDLCKRESSLLDPYCKPVFERLLTQEIKISSKDTRIKAQILMAPVGAVFLSKNSLADVNIPTLLLVPEKDSELSEKYNSKVIKDILEKKGILTYKKISNAGHYSFLTSYPDFLKSKLGIIAQDPEGFDRAAFQKELGKLCATYLKKVL
ncbi:alpha/beta hydrolase family protein [Campylobacterota bacterium DY0563]